MKNDGADDGNNDGVKDSDGTNDCDGTMDGNSDVDGLNDSDGMFVGFDDVDGIFDDKNDGSCEGDTVHGEVIG